MGAKCEEKTEWRCLRKVMKVGVMQIIRNKEIRGRYRNKVSLLGKEDQSTPRWFGHAEKTEEGKSTKRI